MARDKVMRAVVNFCGAPEASVEHRKPKRAAVQGSLTTKGICAEFVAQFREAAERLRHIPRKV
jgi:hypothetical protein